MRADLVAFVELSAQRLEQDIGIAGFAVVVALSGVVASLLPRLLSLLALVLVAKFATALGLPSPATGPALELLLLLLLLLVVFVLLPPALLRAVLAQVKL